MAFTPNYILSTKVSAKWERLYHLLGRAYGCIAHNPNVEVEILDFFESTCIASIEGTTLEREYRTFPTLCVNFLRAYQNARYQDWVILARIVKARYQDLVEHFELACSVAANHKKAIRSTYEHVSLLVRERKRQVERLVLTKTYFEYNSSDIMMKFRCDWLEERIQDITMDIVLERELIRNLELAAEHQETSIARLKEKCTRFFFKLADLDSQRAQCRQSLNYLENQLNSFVMSIRAQFGSTFSP